MPLSWLQMLSTSKRKFSLIIKSSYRMLQANYMCNFEAWYQYWFIINLEISNVHHIYENVIGF
jgi:hypothetical protein